MLDQPTFPYETPGECEICHNPNEDYTPDIQDDDGHSFMAGWTCDTCGAYYRRESKWQGGRKVEIYELDNDNNSDDSKAVQE